MNESRRFYKILLALTVHNIMEGECEPTIIEYNSLCTKFMHRSRKKKKNAMYGPYVFLYTIRKWNT